MKQMTLLAVSVAMALSGCGGGSDGSSGETAAQGTTITAFDGYFYQAVVFDDTNNDGVLTIGTDTIFDLTDENGQYTLPADTEISGSLALQTLIPGGTAQTALANYNSKYVGIYTYDSDNADQVMTHEVVFRAPSSSTVISPITDLVAIEMSSNGGDEEAAKTSVAVSLGISDQVDDVYSDFVSGDKANSKLHKTAQILTESKAVAGDNYHAQAATIVAAAQTQVESMDDEQLTSNTYKPVITVDDSNNASTQLNYKLTVDKTVAESLQLQLSAATLAKNESFAGLSLALDGLFNDKDNTTPTVSTSTTQLGDTGISVSVSNNTLQLGAVNPVAASGSFTITLQANDVDSQGETLTSPLQVVLTLTITSTNQLPVVEEDTQEQLQAIVDGWQLQQGVAFEQTLSLAGLFSDSDGTISDYQVGTISADGLSINVDASQAVVTIAGTPNKAYPAGQTFVVYGLDNEAAKVSASFTLPEIVDGVEPEPETPELGFTLKQFNNQEWKMGSFADIDGEVGYAALLNNDGQLQMCWGTDAQSDPYKTNISDTNMWNNETAFDRLAQLDEVGGTYVQAADKDCWSVELQSDGSLSNVDGFEAKVLYQNTDGDQFLIQVGSQELFWLDGTSTKFANQIAAETKVYAGVTEYQMFVEAGKEFIEALDGPELSYSYAENQLTEGEFETNSVLPTGFYTPGTWSISTDEQGYSYAEFIETEEDQKTRIRYVYRDFGDFYISMGWDEEAQYLYQSAPFFRLFSEDKALMNAVVESLPISKD
ncbi:hypothetical protein K6U56_01430 [Vibrio furnissii]|uniref:hypothetical protein n=1 Tax=Vibrio furnissii TaxID=29494 RepID=UPI001EEBBCA1|nr:hypothetical protein [Vibrio furnissii]MCG6210637.1 hypothetical protein [Vibrio furnissii]